MELKIVEDSKTKLVFELKGLSHGFCTMLKDQLLQDDHVKVATYRVDHPLINIPKFFLETDTASTPRKALQEAIKKLSAFSEKAKKEFQVSIK